PQSVRTNELVREVVAAVRAASDSEGEVSVGSLPAVHGDPTQLGQLFQNLLTNALKFSRPGLPPRVAVSAEPSGDGWTFSVADNGIGVAPEARDRIFQMFQRLHRREDYPGTGIGLAICRRVTDNHGGRIWAEDNAEGGTTFRFTLPGTAISVH